MLGPAIRCLNPSKTLVEKKLLLSGGMLKHNVAHRSRPFLGRARQYNASLKEGMFAFVVA
jgi:hypothetical protein